MIFPAGAAAVVAVAAEEASCAVAASGNNTSMQRTTNTKIPLNFHPFMSVSSLEFFKSRFCYDSVLFDQKSKSCIVGFTGPDPDRLIHIHDEDFTVAHFA